MGAKNTIAGLDIGTTKVCCIVGEPLPEGGIRVLGQADVPCEGMDRGNLVSLEATVDAVSAAVESAGRMADLSIRDVWVGIAGDHVRGINSRGVIGISRREKEVVREDIDRVLDAARAVKIPADREILHAIPRGFAVDEQQGIRDPVGMSGVRLEAEVHIVTAATAPLRNLLRAISRAGLGVQSLVLQPIAASLAVLEDDERGLGVALVDMGGGTSDIVIFQSGVIRHTAILGLGGRHLTQDIAIGLRTPSDRAEELKVRHGYAVSSRVQPAEMVEVAGVGGRTPRQISRQVLAAIIEPRAEEILTLVLHELERCEATDLLAAGVVLTGGTALLPGLTELAEATLGIPARVGYPRPVEGLPDGEGLPQHAAALGLLFYASELERGRAGGGKGILSIFRRPIRDWVRDYL
ncbi:MAG: cell division protein FtsA [Candidatus Eisenbacteria bacterium]|nr:cell division protein FtsA [Candidatus Eisenbacteria bacterium]